MNGFINTYIQECTHNLTNVHLFSNVLCNSIHNIGSYLVERTLPSYSLNQVIIMIILSFDIAPFPYKHAQRRITFIVKGYMLIST